MTVARAAAQGAEGRHRPRPDHREEARRVQGRRSRISKAGSPTSRRSCRKRRTPPTCCAACRWWRRSRISRSRASSRARRSPNSCTPSGRSRSNSTARITTSRSSSIASASSRASSTSPALDVKGQRPARRERHDHRDLRGDDVRAAREADAGKGRRETRGGAGAEGALAMRHLFLTIVLLVACAPRRACAPAAATASAGAAAPATAGRTSGIAAAGRRKLHVSARRPARSVSQPASASAASSGRSREKAKDRRVSASATFPCAA